MQTSAQYLGWDPYAASHSQLDKWYNDMVGSPVSTWGAAGPTQTLGHSAVQMQNLVNNQLKPMGYNSWAEAPIDLKRKLIDQTVQYNIKDAQDKGPLGFLTNPAFAIPAIATLGAAGALGAIPGAASGSVGASVGGATVGAGGGSLAALSGAGNLLATAPLTAATTQTAAAPQFLASTAAGFTGGTGATTGLTGLLQSSIPSKLPTTALSEAGKSTILGAAGLPTAPGGTSLPSMLKTAGEKIAGQKTMGTITDLLKDNAGTLVKGGIDLLGGVLAGNQKSDAANAFANAVQFNPWDVTSPGGNATFANGQVTANLSPELQGRVDMLNSILGDTGTQLQNYSVGDTAARELDLMRRISGGREQQQFNQFQDLLFRQGRLGTTGGSQDLRSFMGAQGTIDLQRQLDAIQSARQEQSRLFNLYNTGMVNMANVANSPLEAARLGGSFGTNAANIAATSSLPAYQTSLSNANSLEDFFTALGQGIGQGVNSYLNPGT